MLVFDYQAESNIRQKRDRNRLASGTVPKHCVDWSNTMSSYENTAQKPDVYRTVTDAIVTAIENGVGNWRMPWHTSGKFAFSPVKRHKP